MATIECSPSIMAKPASRWVCSIQPDNEWCTADDPCFGCAELAHELEHPDMDDSDCPTCRLRSIQLSPAATPTKTRRFGKIGTKGNNSWERQVITDQRGMPILHADGNLIRSKEYAENRRSIEEGRRRLAQGHFT